MARKTLCKHCMESWEEPRDIPISESTCPSCGEGVLPKHKPWKCPSCGMISTTYPALSRRDNKTNICSDCGTREALEDWSNHLKDEKMKKELM